VEDTKYLGYGGYKIGGKLKKNYVVISANFCAKALKYWHYCGNTEHYAISVPYSVYNANTCVIAKIAHFRCSFA
jgi:hypothetical protein